MILKTNQYFHQHSLFVLVWSPESSLLLESSVFFHYIPIFTSSLLLDDFSLWPILFSLSCVYDKIFPLGLTSTTSHQLNKLLRIWNTCMKCMFPMLMMGWHVYVHAVVEVCAYHLSHVMNGWRCLLILRNQTVLFYLSVVRLWKGGFVGRLGLGLGAEESRMLEVLYWTVGHSCGTASCFCWHWIWIQQP